MISFWRASSLSSKKGSPVDFMSVNPSIAFRSAESPRRIKAYLVRNSSCFSKSMPRFPSRPLGCLDCTCDEGNNLWRAVHVPQRLAHFLPHRQVPFDVLFECCDFVWGVS